MPEPALHPQPAIGAEAGAARPQSTQLPRYSAPPLVEVAISVQFDEIAQFKSAHFGLLWERFRDRYPRTEHYPPLGSVVELFGGQGSERATLAIDSGFPIGRCWYLSADEQQVIQVQPDRFILNWRKSGAHAQYPSYEALRGVLRRELNTLIAFITDEHLGQFQPVQCEMTYVNHLPVDEGWTARKDLPNVIVPWSGSTTGTYLPDVEDARLAWQYRFDEGGKPLGRLYVEVQSAIRAKDRLQLYILQLIGRGAPMGLGVDGVVAFTDRAHEWIVNGFTAITTERMHTIWERQL